VKPAPFEYIRAESVSGAVTALAEHPGSARLLAGGQSLVPMLHMRLMRPAVIVDINRVPGLDQISDRGDHITVGPMVRYSTIERSPLVAKRLGLLAHVTRHIGDRQVRNRGTIGGSLAQADPTGEMPLACLALDAAVVAATREGRREIPIGEFLHGPYMTALGLDEMIIELRFPGPAREFAFREIVRRHNDFAVLAIAATGVRSAGGTLSGVRVAIAGIDDHAVLVHEAGTLLEGGALDDERIAAAARACADAADPPSDVRASAEYRRHLVGVHVPRVLRALRAGGSDGHG